MPYNRKPFSTFYVKRKYPSHRSIPDFPYNEKKDFLHQLLISFRTKCPFKYIGTTLEIIIARVDSEKQGYIK